MEKKDLLGMNLRQLTEEMTALGASSFRANQIFHWLHVRQVFQFSKMTDLSKQFQEQLGETFYINMPKITQTLASCTDNTVKYLYRLKDGNMVESVRMVYRHGVTACISTQAGCRMGCRFCASAPLGLVRNLTPSEMLGQIYAMEQEDPEKNRIHSVVLMGIGEPLDNYENVLHFLRLISDPDGRDLSPRHITLSTCGIVPMIRRLSKEGLPLTLSVSLHAADNATRSELMPVNRSYPLEELLAACQDYFQQTGRRVTFEYAVIAGKNDTPRHARQLASLLCRAFPESRPHINLIPVNPVGGSGFRPGQTAAFQQLLTKLGINATVRRTLGEDIKAACGQLRRNAVETQILKPEGG